MNDDQYLLPPIKPKVRSEIGSATGIRFMTSEGEMKINAGECFEVPFEYTTFEEVQGMSSEEMGKTMREKEDKILRKLLISSSCSADVLDLDHNHQSKENLELK